MSAVSLWSPLASSPAAIAFDRLLILFGLCEQLHQLIFPHALAPLLFKIVLPDTRAGVIFRQDEHSCRN